MDRKRKNTKEKEKRDGTKTKVGKNISWNKKT